MIEAPYDLQRFVSAQAAIYGDVIDELHSGRKTSHWMWFVFPQLQGLGSSPMARKFAISSREEAAAYLDHPILGTRLRECAELVCAVEDHSIHDIFGSPDDLKFHSSMTLFAQVAEDGQVFRQALDKYFEGQPDPRTLEILGSD